MDNIKNIVEDAFTNDNQQKVKEILENTNQWNDAYEVGMTLLEHSESHWDRIVVEALERSFFFGLNVISNRECFLNATKEIAKLYFQYSDYENAKSHLILLTANEENLPDWVHLYFATTQIYTDDLVRIAEEPFLFFSRLEKIDNSNQESIFKRASIYRACLTAIANAYNSGKVTQIAIKAFNLKAEEYGLADASELYALKVALGIETPLLELQDEEEPSVDDGTDENVDEPDVFEQDVTDSVGEQTVQSAIEEKDALIAKLESELSEALNKNASLEKQLVNSNNAVKNLNEVIIKLQAKINELEKNVKKQPVVDTPETVEQPDKPIIQPVVPELTTTQDAPLEDIEVSKYIPKNKRILIMGGSVAKEKDLRGVCKSLGYIFNKKDLEFVLDYDAIKTVAGRIKPWSCAYAGIIVGPSPHKTEGSGDYSSFIEKIKNEEGYPPVVEAKEKNGTLKLSKTSFREAISSMVNRLIATA